MAVQFIKSARRGKSVTWYVYAFKGGPRIMTHVGPRRPTLDAAASQKLATALAEREAPVSPETFGAVIRAWRLSPEWEQLARQTKSLWRSHLDLIEVKWAGVPTAVWNDPRMKKVVAWRNTRKETPRAADNGVVVLCALLKWAALNGHGVAINVAANIPRLYKGGDRQEIIWLQDDIDRFVAEARDRPPTARRRVTLGVTHRFQGCGLSDRYF